VGFDEMGQLLVMYFGFIRYWKKKKQRDYNEAVHRIQGSP